MCVGADYLTFDILLHENPTKKNLGNKFCTLKIFKYMLERERERETNNKQGQKVVHKNVSYG